MTSKEDCYGFPERKLTRESIAREVIEAICLRRL